MNRIVRDVLLAMAGAAIVCPAATAGPITLVDEGRPSAMIVLAETPTPAARKAATIIRDSLREISGAALEVVSERRLDGVSVRGNALVTQPGGPARTFILVGESGLTAKLGVFAQGLGAGGVHLQTFANTVALFGPDEATPTDRSGTLHAATLFLEMLGCRRLWPGPLGKIVPLDPPGGRPIRLHYPELRPGAAEPTTVYFDYVSLTDRVFTFYNEIAARVTKVYPDMLFGVHAYSYYSAPPIRAKVHPNLVLAFVPTPIFYVNRTDHERIVGEWDGWAKAGARLLLRPNLFAADRPTSVLINYTHRLAADLRHFAATGMIGSDFDSLTHNWATGGINYYAATRLLWDPELDIDALVAGYCRAGFGPAAPFIQDYLRRIEACTDVAYTREIHLAEPFTSAVLADLRALLERADNAAQGNPDVLARLAFLRRQTAGGQRGSLNFTQLFSRSCERKRADPNRNVPRSTRSRSQPRKVLIGYNFTTMPLQVISRRIGIAAVVFAGATAFAAYPPGPPVNPISDSPLEYYAQGGVVVDGIAYFTSDPGSSVRTGTRGPDFHGVVAFDVRTLKKVRTYHFQPTYDSSPFLFRRKDGTWLIIAHEYQKARTVALERDTGNVAWISAANQPGGFFFGYSIYRRTDGTSLLFQACKNGLHALSGTFALPRELQARLVPMREIGRK